MNPSSSLARRGLPERQPATSGGVCEKPDPDTKTPRRRKGGTRNETRGKEDDSGTEGVAQIYLGLLPVTRNLPGHHL